MTAETLWAAIKERLPMDYEELAAHSELLGISLGHDSHKANIRCQSMVFILLACKGGSLIVHNECGFVICTPYKRVRCTQIGALDPLTCNL